MASKCESISLRSRSTFLIESAEPLADFVPKGTNRMRNVLSELFQNVQEILSHPAELEKLCFDLREVHADQSRALVTVELQEGMAIVALIAKGGLRGPRVTIYESASNSSMRCSSCFTRVLKSLIAS